LLKKRITITNYLRMNLLRSTNQRELKNRFTTRRERTNGLSIFLLRDKWSRSKMLFNTNLDRLSLRVKKVKMERALKKRLDLRDFRKLSWQRPLARKRLVMSISISTLLNWRIWLHSCMMITWTKKMKGRRRKQ